MYSNLIYIISSWIIGFKLPIQIDTNAFNKLLKGLYGQDSKSRNGKYEFYRKGIKKEVPS